ncbi:MAG: hypothetical protein WDO73_01310 [Ignavibacteriota bacterium]
MRVLELRAIDFYDCVGIAHHALSKSFHGAGGQPVLRRRLFDVPGSAFGSDALSVARPGAQRSPSHAQ